LNFPIKDHRHNKIVISYWNVIKLNEKILGKTISPRGWTKQKKNKTEITTQ